MPVPMGTSMTALPIKKNIYYSYIEKEGQIDPLTDDDHPDSKSITKKERIRILQRYVNDNAAIAADADNLEWDRQKMKDLLIRYNLLEYTPSPLVDTTLRSKVVFFRRSKDQGATPVALRIGDTSALLPADDYVTMDLQASVPLKACIGENYCAIIEVFPLETYFEINQDANGESSIESRDFNETGYYIREIKRGKEKNN